MKRLTLNLIIFLFYLSNCTNQSAWKAFIENIESATAAITNNNYIEYWRAYRETRVANLTLTYRFGSNKVAQARRRTLGSEEERQRAQ